MIVVVVYSFFLLPYDELCGYICRGKFVMEYVGEILTHFEAEERGWTYDRSSLRLVMFGCRVMCL